MANKVQLKRVFDHADEQDRSRFFVERLWPRGVDKSALADTARLESFHQAQNCPNGSITIPSAGMNSAGGISLS
jgi:hypothetical protein